MKATLSVLTLNIGAASDRRARAILEWLSARSEDVYVLTETSKGPGSSYLAEQFRSAGYYVEHQSDPGGDRGVMLASRIPIRETLRPGLAGVTLPNRVAGVVLDTEPSVSVLGLYIPSRDRSQFKISKKLEFIQSILTTLQGFTEDIRDGMLLAGDYNVISRDHKPAYPGFLDFEYGFLEDLDRIGLFDAQDCCNPGVQAHSWIGRTQDGYRYDYFHVGPQLVDRLLTCSYLHETRDRNLSDHAAVSLSLSVERAGRLNASDLNRNEQMELWMD